MFRIAICDDESHFRKRIREILIDYLNKKGILYEIDEFESGKDFINLGIEIVKYKIVFMDINMDELDGMETAQKIQDVSNDIFIVFVTAFVNYAIEGYRVDAVRYILKNNVNFSELVFECMDAITMKMNYVVKKKTFNLHGGFNEKYFNAWEGMELGLKITLNGGKCYYNPLAKAKYNYLDLEYYFYKRQ